MNGLNLKIVLKKGLVQIVYGAGFAALFAALGWFANTTAVTDALHRAGAGDAMAGAIALVIVGAAKAGLNYMANRKVLISPVDDQPVNAPALKSPPVLQTEAQHDAFVAELDRLRATGVEFDVARRQALSVVTDVTVAPK